MNTLPHVAPGLKLKKLDPEPRVHIVITDRPDFDVEGREVNAVRYEVFVRPPGFEEFYEVEPEFGGHICGEQIVLDTDVYIRLWREAHLTELTAVASTKGQAGVPCQDGPYHFVVYAKDANGYASKPSKVLRLQLDMTPPEPPAFDAVPVPNSIAIP